MVLRVPELQGLAATEAGRLLRVLLVRHEEVSARSGWRRLLHVLMCRHAELRFGADSRYSTFTVRKRNALPITLTEDSAMAAAATTGESNKPKKGYSTPAASGMPATL